MNNFNFYLPVNLVFGRGTVSKVGEIASKYGKKAMLVIGGGSVKKSGLLDRVIKHLSEYGIAHAIYENVPPNPLTDTALDCAGMIIEEGCDMVIGVGGGSIMDCAKNAAFMAVNDGDINDYIFGRLQSDKALPIILIPTTCGTGSEGNCFGVLTNPKTGDKKSLRCNAIIAKASIIDSECMMTMPNSLLASVGFDALCHCMEAYMSTIGQPIIDLLSHRGMELIAENLVKVYDGDGDARSYDALTLASTFGGMSINTAGVALPHGMEHPCSGLKNITHGKGLAALTPVITEESVKKAVAENNEFALSKYAEISKILGGNGSDDCADAIRRLLDKINLSLTLSDQGIEEKDVDWLTENCMKVSAANLKNHPVHFEKDEVHELYMKCL